MRNATAPSTGPSFSPMRDGHVTSDETTEWEQDGFTLRASLAYDDISNQGGPDYIGRIHYSEHDARNEGPGHGKRGEPVRVEYRSRVYQGYTGTVWLALDESRYDGDYPDEEKERWREQDIARVKAFLEDEWTYYVLRVEARKDGVLLGDAYLGAIESDSGDYFNEAAREIAGEALSEAKETLADLCPNDKLLQAAKGVLALGRRYGDGEITREAFLGNFAWAQLQIAIKAAGGGDDA